MSAWLLSGATVLGAQSLNRTCGTSSGCSSTWHVVDTISDNTILWDNPTSGFLQDWVFDDNSIVNTRPALTWQCAAASGCSAAWQPIGRIRYIPSCSSGLCSSAEGLAWYNAGTGQVSIWKLLGSTVTGAETVSWTCAGSCAQVWRPVLTADFDNDGNSDILWYNAGTGQLSVWLLDGTGTVLGTQTLSWTCSQSSGCASAWRLVGAGDANGDGNVDLLWHNAASGQLSNWLLDGHGNVTGSPVLSWTCAAASGCASSWHALGYIQYP
jgi:hypothetical protein